MKEEIASARLGLFVCGAQKGGTSALAAYLRQHPGLSPPPAKELHFFDDEARCWARPDYTALEAGFAPADGRLRYECTPAYGFWRPALARIAAYHPAARLVFVLRDPFHRAWSHWCMEYARGAESLPFAEAIRAGRRRLRGRGGLDPAWRAWSYVERGFYGLQLARARGHFPAAQILCLRSEDLAADPAGTLARLAGFAGLAPFPPLAPLRVHEAPRRAWPCAPTEADRALVMAELAADLADCTRLSGLDTGGWGTCLPAVRSPA
ncbi:MAG TPA: sulfotransferase [Novosphingobium sp.]|nr:sulfotransferase [Novosphingobium sp.]